MPFVGKGMQPWTLTGLNKSQGDEYYINFFLDN